MPWSELLKNSRSLRNISRKKISDEIFIPLKTEKQWKLLIVDDFGMKIISSCFKTEEVMAFNIALIEYLDKMREPVRYLSAIYLCYPSPDNIALLQRDFLSRPAKYLNAHLFFLSELQHESFDRLLKCANPDFVKTLKEVDFLFLPLESQVFSLNDGRFFPIFFDSYKEMDFQHCALIAKKLATVCSTLQAWPKIRYRRQCVKTLILAEALKAQLCFYHDRWESCHHNAKSKINEKLNADARVEILIIDRGFDCVSPLVHECTLQAMAYDLLDIEDDIYEFFEGEIGRTISLIEADPVWCRLRHEHIAEVAKLIEKLLETDSLLWKYSNVSRFKRMPELCNPALKYFGNREYKQYSMYRHIANECIRLYCNGINVISEIMQDLAVGTIAKNSCSKHMRSTLLNILRSSNYNIPEKLRLLILYIFYLKGITKNEFNDIIANSELPLLDARIITNVLHLDVDIFKPKFCKAVDYISLENGELTSPNGRTKWLPAVKNIMLSCIEGNLSENKYPYLDNDVCATRNIRTGYWCRDNKSEHVSRLIVFIAGGVTYSEMRCAYEVMSVHTGWEIYIGGDLVLTPKIFLDKLKQLRCLL